MNKPPRSPTPPTHARIPPGTPCAEPACTRAAAVSGRRFGLAPGAALCARCYGRRAYLAAREAVAATPWAPPCHRCGTTGGLVRADGTRPVRYRATEGGREVRVCHECRWVGVAPDSADDPDPGSASGSVGEEDRPDDDAADPAAPDPTELRLRVQAVLRRRARRYARAEAARRAGPGRAAGLSPREGAARAVKEYDATAFGGPLARWWGEGDGDGDGDEPEGRR